MQWLTVAIRIRKHRGRRHLIIPDTQIRPGVPTKHLEWIAAWALKHHESYPFDLIIQLGDWYDMPSLSSYDEHGRRPKNVEGKRLRSDFDVAHEAADMFCAAIDKIDCEKVFLRGNHENRVQRWEDDDARFEGYFEPFAFDSWGWKEVPFLHPYKRDGIAYNHYWPINAHGDSAAGGTTAKNGCNTALAQVQRVGMSCVAGHKQGFDYSIMNNPMGQSKFGLIAGSCYLHSEEYRGPMGSREWRGIVTINDIHRGFGDIMPLSLDYLGREYG